MFAELAFQSLDYVYEIMQFFGLDQMWQEIDWAIREAVRFCA